VDSCCCCACCEVLKPETEFCCEQSLQKLAKQAFAGLGYRQSHRNQRTTGPQGDDTLKCHPVPLQVFLSATLANATEFAAWVAGLHKQPCHVVYTDFRPTPLQHYAFPVGGNGLYAVRNLTATPVQCSLGGGGLHQV
jgi:hypothetical protein